MSPFFDDRKGRRLQVVQADESDDREILVGVITDTTEPFPA